MWKSTPDSPQLTQMAQLSQLKPMPPFASIHLITHCLYPWWTTDKVWVSHMNQPSTHEQVCPIFSPYGWSSYIITQDCSMPHATALTGSQWCHSKLLWLAWDHFYDTSTKMVKWMRGPWWCETKKSHILNHNTVFTRRAFWLTPTVTLQCCFNCYSKNITLPKWCTPWLLLLTLSRGECKAKAYMQHWMSELPRT